MNRKRRSVVAHADGVTTGTGRGQIPEMVSIHVRPPEVDDRVMPGHWEGGLLKGAGNKSSVAVLVERTSRLVLLNATAEAALKATGECQKVACNKPEVPALNEDAAPADNGSRRSFAHSQESLVKHKSNAHPSSVGLRRSAGSRSLEWRPVRCSVPTMPPAQITTFRTTSHQDVDRALMHELLADESVRHRFEHCAFDGQDLEGVDLRGVEFLSCRFVQTLLDRASLSDTRWVSCQCAGAAFDHADLADAQFARCDLNNSSWNYAKLAGASFVDVKLTGARFLEARTLGMSVRNSLLVSADLRSISFRKQVVEGLNLTGADLAGCDFSDAVLIGCDLTNASLKNTRFAGADLRQSRLGDIQVGDLLSHFKGSTISMEQAADLVGALGVNVIR